MHIYIWGTGNYASRVEKYIEHINAEFHCIVFEICGYIDSNVSLVGTIRHGFEVYDPSFLQSVGDDSRIVIAVKNDISIINKLVSERITDFYRFRDFVYSEIALFEEVENSKKQYLFASSEMQGVLERIRHKQRVRELLDLNETYTGVKKDVGVNCAIASLFSEYGSDYCSIRNYANEISGKKKRGDTNTIGLYYPRFFNGGVERVISRLMGVFRESGFGVVLFTDHNSSTEKEYTIPQGVIRCILPSRDIFPYQWIMEMAKNLKRYNVGVLCNHDSVSECVFYLGLLAKESGIVFLNELHNHFSVYNYSNDQFRVLFSHVDCLVTLSESDNSYWRSLGFTSKYIPNPVCLPENRTKRDNIFHSILWIGRLSQFQKNIYDIVDVMDTIRKINSQIHLRVVGMADDTRIYDELLARIEEADLGESIELCGYDTDVTRYYRTSDLMIMTSSFEGFSMTLAEAMGHGLPTVMYELPYLELVKAKKGYVAVRQGDSEAMALEVCRLIADNKELQRLSDEAIENIENFKKVDLVREWKEVFD